MPPGQPLARGSCTDPDLLLRWHVAACGVCCTHLNEHTPLGGGAGWAGRAGLCLGRMAGHTTRRRSKQRTEKVAVGLAAADAEAEPAGSTNEQLISMWQSLAGLTG